MNTEKISMTIQIDNLTQAQKIAIEDMMAQWQRLGNIGSSRWTMFFSDGDGNFRPKITVNDNKPKHTDYIPDKEKWSKIKFLKNLELDEWSRSQEIYLMDFDSIAIKLREENK